MNSSNLKRILEPSIALLLSKILKMHVCRGKFKITSFPDNRLNGITSDGACNHKCLSSYDGLLLHWSNIGQSIDVEFGGVFGGTDFAAGKAFVLATVVGVDRGDIQI